jgi:AmiR/NasT family two-component response regulator
MEVQSTPRSAEPISDSNDELMEELSLENDQLRHALDSRIVIEQAKGSISARSNVPVDVAFEMLRAVARNRQQKITHVAAEVIANGGRLNAGRMGTTPSR